LGQTSTDLDESQYISTTASSFTPHAAISISENDDFISQGWPGNGTAQFPYIIEGMEISTDSTCIRIANTSACFIIRNCTLSSTTSGNGIGIYLLGVGHGIIDNCTISSLGYGIRLTSIVDCVFSNNTITDCANYGIYSYSSETVSDDVLYDSNEIYNNHGYPIYLAGSNNGMILNNSIYDNDGSLRFYIVNYLGIINNTISGSSTDGFYLDFTSGIEIIGNKIYGNAGYGLRVNSYALQSEIYNNMIGFNGIGNAVDSGMFNDWDNGAGIGNIWSDYSGVGDYSVGIGKDDYPLGFVSRPIDVQYEIGEAVSPITWDVRLPNPDSYAIYWEGSMIAQNTLNSSLNYLSKAIDGLSIGSYNLTLAVNDESGYSLVDTVIITVEDETVTTSTTTATTTTTTTSTSTSTTTDTSTDTTTSTGTTSTTTNTITTSSPLLDGATTLVVGVTGIIGAIVVLIILIRKK
jgi:parallel beta-helix repeat protein